MNLEMLKAYKAGDKVDMGVLFPTLDDNESIQWTVTAALDMTRAVGNTVTKPRMVEFHLTYLDISLGSIRAIENSDGTIAWETVKWRCPPNTRTGLQTH